MAHGQRDRGVEAARQEVHQFGAGDVVCVQGTGRIAQIGAVGGFLGHVLVLLGPPKECQYTSAEGENLRQFVPSAVWPLWLFQTMECTSSTEGLHIVHQVISIEETSGRFVLVGELKGDDDFTEYEDAAVEFWRAPLTLRNAFRAEIMNKVINDMRECKVSWSLATAFRAVLRSAHIDFSTVRNLPEEQQVEILQELRECWTAEPICTSVVISFWQRYLCELAAAHAGSRESLAAQLVLKWMPLKADRALPGDLLGTMLKCGFTLVKDRPVSLATRR